MTARAASIEETLALAIRHVNASQPERARQICESALLSYPPHAGVLQLLALLCLKDGQLARASECIAASVALRPDHGPSLLVAGDAARANGDHQAALVHHTRARTLLPDRAESAHALGLTLQACGRLTDAQLELTRAVVLAPARADAWFELALVRQDLHDFNGAVVALQTVLQLAPARAEVEVNLGIVLQEAGRLDEALRAFGRAYRMREDTFGRIAHALSTPDTGCLWLDLDVLRSVLRGLPA